jgi:hypothetical protein
MQPAGATTPILAPCCKRRGLCTVTWLLHRLGDQANKAGFSSLWTTPRSRFHGSGLQSHFRKKALIIQDFSSAFADKIFLWRGSIDIFRQAG